MELHSRQNGTKMNLILITLFLRKKIVKHIGKAIKMRYYT